MDLYSYVITRDFGFAPNPFHGICSLATCKPQIRQHAHEGDWIAGFGSADTTIKHKLVFLMQIDESCTFDEYWNDPRFIVKKPRFDRNYQYCYGDNIYHHIGDEWMQENSHHSYENGINKSNLVHDTRIDRVLISFHYWYFGADAIELPEEFEQVIATKRGYKKISDTMCCTLVDWVTDYYDMGQNGIPYKWGQTDAFVRFKGERK